MLEINALLSNTLAFTICPKSTKKIQCFPPDRAQAFFFGGGGFCFIPMTRARLL